MSHAIGRGGRYERQQTPRPDPRSCLRRVRWRRRVQGRRLRRMSVLSKTQSPLFER